MSEWQPIETAPKDGAYILGYDGSEIVIMEWWEPDSQMFFEGARPAWLASGGYDVDATHWMPLPAPPHTQEPG